MTPGACDCGRPTTRGGAWCDQCRDYWLDVEDSELDTEETSWP